MNGEQVTQGASGYTASTNDHDPAQAVRGPTGLGIRWTGSGILQSAGAVNGPFADAASTGSPATPPTSTAAQYYRLRR